MLSILYVVTIPVTMDFVLQLSYARVANNDISLVALSVKVNRSKTYRTWCQK